MVTANVLAVIILVIVRHYRGRTGKLATAIIISSSINIDYIRCLYYV